MFKTAGCNLTIAVERRINLSVFISCLLVYYLVIARRYFETDVIGGDTRGVWSVHYFVLESLVEYLQYPLL